MPFIEKRTERSLIFEAASYGLYGAFVSAVMG
jgi:hypothetical protein